MSYLIFSKIKKDVASLSSAAVVISAVRVNLYKTIVHLWDKGNNAEQDQTPHDASCGV